MMPAPIRKKVALLAAAGAVAVMVASPIVYVWPRSARREAVRPAARRRRRTPAGAL